MKKGIVFTMDSAFALYISLLIMSTLMVILEASNNYSGDPTALSRLARDVYEVKSYNSSVSIPTFIKTGSACDPVSISEVGSTQNLVRDDIGTDSWTTVSSVHATYQKVCYG